MMTDSDRRARIKELEGLIAKARDSYYNKQPEVSDEVYDAWVDELSELDTLNQILSEIGSPPVSEWVKVKHRYPMGSLNKVNTLEELTDWAQNYASGEFLLVSEKLDGISVQVHYVNGALTQATTRGDGFVGEDITVNVARMKGVPDRLPQKVTCSLRGEIILRKSDHAKFFKADYANTRNAASGIAKRYDGRGCENLTVLFYEVMSGITFSTCEEQLKFISGLGLSTPWWAVSGLRVGVKTPHDIWVEYHQTKRDSLDYDIDGLVVEVNDLNKQFALGEKDLRPVGAVAFKFAPITRETTLRQITWQTGATGRLTPVARFDVVNLLGTNVEFASVYNLKYIQTLGLDIGARILVARANDVIPRVVAVVKSTGSVAKAPEACPACAANVTQEGEFHVCVNKDCPAQVVGRLAQWVTSLGILEWGDVLLEKVVNARLVRSIPDLYRLKESDLAGLERMGEASASKALGLLRSRMTLPMDALLGSLSIPGIASETIRHLMSNGFDTIESLRSANLSQILSVKGIGPVKANALIDWFRTQGSIIDELESVGVQVEKPIRGKFSGKSFCFTGVMNHSREDLEDMVTSNGGDVKDRVTKKLTYLVLADTTTVKAATARKYGTTCLSEDEFLAMLDG